MEFPNLMMDEADRSWMDRAICRGLSPDLFHPVRGDQQTQNEAKCVCNGTQRPVKDKTTKKWHLVGQPPCPVKDECLNYIMSLPSSQDGCGVWGGLSHKQRQKLRSQMDRANRVRMRPRCGTPAGYVHHRRLQETACDACKEANAEDKRHRKAAKRSINLTIAQD